MKAERQEVFTRNHETSHARPLQRPSMDYSRLGPYPSVLLLSIHLFPYFVPLRPLFRCFRPVLLSWRPVLTSWRPEIPILRFLRSIPSPCVLSSPFCALYLLLASLRPISSASCPLFSGPCNLSSSPLVSCPPLLTSFSPLPALCPSLLVFCPPLPESLE
jgi:hypothetical protein